MAKKTTPSRQIIQEEIAALNEPVVRSVFEDRVLARWPSTAKTARGSMRNMLRYDFLGRHLVMLDNQMVLPIGMAMQGVRFRIPISAKEAKRGMLLIQPAFDHLLDGAPLQVALVDAQGAPLPTQILEFSEQRRDLLLGSYTATTAAFDLSAWFRANRIAKGDDVLVTILNWSPPRYQLEHEPARRRQRARIAKQDSALADVFWALLQETYDERLMISAAVPTAYARLPGAREYPGSHWTEALRRDGRMQDTFAFITTADYLSPLESMMMPPEATTFARKHFSREQGRQVYRFEAHVPRSKKSINIEIQGSQTLDDFDDVVREAFHLDPVDHLSEFTIVVSRGKGKRPHETPLGTINPFEHTEAAELRVASLGLTAGARLDYVHDFGDMNEVQLNLLDIVPPERGASYPRTEGSIPLPPELDEDDGW